MTIILTFPVNMKVLEDKAEVLLASSVAVSTSLVTTYVSRCVHLSSAFLSEQNSKICHIGCIVVHLMVLLVIAS